MGYRGYRAVGCDLEPAFRSFQRGGPSQLWVNENARSALGGGEMCGGLGEVGGFGGGFGGKGCGVSFDPVLDHSGKLLFAVLDGLDSPLIVPDKPSVSSSRILAMWDSQDARGLRHHDAPCGRRGDSAAALPRLRAGGGGNEAMALRDGQRLQTLFPGMPRPAGDLPPAT